MGEHKRNHLIDLIKGLLIILVIIGHILPGTLVENPIRYIIYSFHMPAFFYISGMLYSGRSSLKDYGLRLGVPWLIAVQVYYVLLNYRTITFTSYLKSFVTPYYHLWFVVGFFFCVVVVKLCKENKWILLSLGIILSFLSAALNGNDYIVWKFIDHTIRPQYLLFFAMGLLVKNNVGGGTQKGYYSGCIIHFISADWIPHSRDLVGAFGQIHIAMWNILQYKLVAIQR